MLAPPKSPKAEEGALTTSWPLAACVICAMVDPIIVVVVEVEGVVVALISLEPISSSRSVSPSTCKIRSSWIFFRTFFALMFVPTEKKIKRIV